MADGAINTGVANTRLLTRLIEGLARLTAASPLSISAVKRKTQKNNQCPSLKTINPFSGVTSSYYIP
jgi:hypothetical protein